MAKGNSGGEDRAKVKLRVIEFELEGANASVENSIRQLTSALANRTVAVSPLQAKPQKELAGTAPSKEVEPVEENIEIIDTETVETNGDDVPAGKPAKKGKPKPPTFINELNLIGNGASFKDFAKEKAPESRKKQYLVAAYWLKVHGDSPTVNADKVYTCFKTANWPTPFNDWAQTFHNLVHSEHMRKVGKAEFAINSIGEDAVSNGTEA
jgi:hypothetical protein